MGKWEICWKIQEFVLEPLLYKGLIKANLKLLGKRDSLIATYIEDLSYWDGWSAPSFKYLPEILPAALFTSTFFKTFKGTLIQIWKPANIVVFIWK